MESLVKLQLNYMVYDRHNSWFWDLRKLFLVNYGFRKHKNLKAADTQH